MEIKTLHLKPTVYSKAQKYDKFKAGLEAASKQEANTTEAFKGNVFEFVVKGTSRPVGTLDEYRRLENADIIIIHFQDAVAIVEYRNGEFTVTGVKQSEDTVVSTV